MPLQNRVTPFGELIATPAKGTFMGNRGIFHDEHGELTVKRWSHKSWVTCALSFKDYKRSPNVRTPNNYTELFFLDEATALAAGHRPCRQCRYKEFVTFVAMWTEANDLPADTMVEVIDKRLHAERVTRLREKITYKAQIDDLPNGVFVAFSAAPLTAWLLWNDAMFEWRPDGYGDRRGKPRNISVDVLTPRSILNAIKVGYVPKVAMSR